MTDFPRYCSNLNFCPHELNILKGRIIDKWTSLDLAFRHLFDAKVEMLEEMDSKRRLLQNQLELKERQDVLALLEEEAAFELEQERSRREAAEAKVRDGVAM